MIEKPWDARDIIDQTSLHETYKISVFSSNSTHKIVPGSALYKKLLLPHRSFCYLFLLMKNGSTIQFADFKKYTLKTGDVFIIFPGQVYSPSIIGAGNIFCKVVFDNNILTHLSERFSFLVNPLNKQLLCIDEACFKRLTFLFDTIENNLNQNCSNTELLLGYLNMMLLELSKEYYAGTKALPNNNPQLQLYINFKQLIEERLKDHPAIEDVAKELNVSNHKLYTVVKYYAQMSPKGYLINRLLIEAQRIKFNSDITVQQLAYELGFNDPDYFSRLFKKRFGKSISSFYKEFGNSSSN